MQVELTEEEAHQIVMMIEATSVQIKHAQTAIALLEKFKNETK